MRGAEFDLNPTILADACPRRLQRMKEMLRQSQCGNDVRIICAGLCVHHAGRGGVGIFVRLRAAKAIQEIFGDHEEIGHADPGFMLRQYAHVLEQSKKRASDTLMRTLFGQNM